MDIYNYGLTHKIVIPNEELPNIIGMVSEIITVKIENWKFTGELLKVVSKKIKDENREPEIFKELTILVDSITFEDGSKEICEHLVMPVKKEIFIENTDIK